MAGSGAGRSDAGDPDEGRDGDSGKKAAQTVGIRDAAGQSDAPAEPAPSRDRGLAVADAAGGRTAGPESGPIRSADPVVRSDAAARVESIDALREQEARQPLRRVSVRVGEGESAARVRVNLRGDAVQSEMATESERLASRLGRELPELNRALRSQGLEPDALRVRHGEKVVAAEVNTPRPAGSGRSGGENQEQMSQRSGNQHEPHDGRRRNREHSNEEGNE